MVALAFGDAAAATAAATHRVEHIVAGAATARQRSRFQRVEPRIMGARWFLLPFRPTVERIEGGRCGAAQKAVSMMARLGSVGGRINSDATS